MSKVTVIVNHAPTLDDIIFVGQAMLCIAVISLALIFITSGIPWIYRYIRYEIREYKRRKKA